MFSKLPQTVRESYTIMWKNKLIVFLLMILHIIFILGLGVMTFHYVVTLTTSYQEVGEYLAQTTQSAQDLEGYAQQFDVENKNDPANALEAGRTIEAAKLGLQETRKTITQGTFKLLTLFGTFYILIAGLSWSLTHKIIKKEKMKGMRNYFKKFVMISLPSITIVLSILYYVSSEANKQLFLHKPANEYLVGVLFIFLLGVLYLMYFFYTHIGKKMDKQWLKLVMKKSVKHSPYSGVVLFLSLIIVSFPYVVLDWMMDNDSHQTLILLSFLLTSLFVVYGRIFYYKALHTL